jgi:hypothetical protein
VNQQLTPDEESIDADIFMQIIASRSIHGAIPSRMLIIHSFIYLLIAIGEFIGLYFVTLNICTLSFPYPMRVYQLGKLQKKLCNCFINITRYCLVINGGTFFNDTLTELKNGIFTEVESIMDTFIELVSTQSGTISTFLYRKQTMKITLHYLSN